MQTKPHKPSKPRAAPVPPFMRNAKHDWEEGLALAKAGEWTRAELAFQRAAEREPKTMSTW